MKKVLILGAKGNLGGQLVKVFKDNYEVAAYDSKELDITDKDLVIKKIEKVKPDVIINAAAYNAVDKCETPEGYKIAKKLNGEAPGYLAEAAARVGAVLVHYSSDYVFGEDTNGTNLERIERIKSQGGFREDDEPSPISKYGETKLMGERAILKYNDLKYYIIRTSKLFGPKGKSELTKDSFFDIMLRMANNPPNPPYQGGNSPQPPLHADKIDVVDEEVSCFTYTPDLARATKDLIESGKEYGVYHITNSGPCTWYEAAKELFRIAGLDVNVNPVSSDKFPRPAKRPKYSVLLNTKLEPMRDYKNALREYLSKKL